MTQDRLADPLPPTQDIDYVACFDALATVLTSIREQGPTADLLLRKAMLELEMGNFSHGLTSAKDAVTAAPRNAEAHYQEALAWLWMARLQVGRATLAPGAPVPVQRPLREVLEQAQEALESAFSCAQEDPDVAAELAWVDALLEFPDASLEDAMRASTA